MNTPTRVRRLFYDLETSPNVVLSWRVGFKINLNPDCILGERKVICVGYKWEGDTKTNVIVWDKNKDDKFLLEEFSKVAETADELVAHNGDGFDLPWLKTRLLFHGINALPLFKTVDTMQWAKRRYYFNSYKLDYIGKFLGLGGKIHTGLSLWKEVVVENDRKALGKMAEYCARDVELLEKVYERLKFCAKPKTHAGVFSGGEKWACPYDGSTNVKLSKRRVTSAGTEQFQMQCLDCGAYFSIAKTAYNDYVANKSNDKKTNNPKTGRKAFVPKAHRAR